MTDGRISESLRGQVAADPDTGTADGVLQPCGEGARAGGGESAHLGSDGGVSEKNVLTLPWPPRDLSPNERRHWAQKAKAAKKYRADCYRLTKASGIKISWWGEIHLWITFYPPDRRNRDDDNIIASFKAGRDGIAEALGIDDRLFRLHPWVSDTPVKYGQIRVRFSKGPNDA